MHFPLNGINGGFREQHPLIHTPKFDVFQFQLAISDSIFWVTSGVCTASEDPGVSWPDLCRWLHSCNLWHQWLSKSFKHQKIVNFYFKFLILKVPGSNQGKKCRLSGSSNDWSPKKSWWCFAQLVKSLSQLDMNFTTLIMLIFTAILAIGLVLKGLTWHSLAVQQWFIFESWSLWHKKYDLERTFPSSAEVSVWCNMIYHPPVIVTFKVDLGSFQESCCGVPMLI